MLFVIFVGLACLAASAYFVGDAVTMPARERRTSVRRAAQYGAFKSALGQAQRPFRERVLAPLGERMDGPLADEFALTLSEIRIGEARPDALKKLAARTDTPELNSFVRSIIQADQLGISLGRILRVQATDSRLKRQAAAEEKAMKAPIKMLFPTVIFIFPAMFIVLLGPAVMNIMKVLG